MLKKLILGDFIENALLVPRIVVPLQRQKVNRLF